MGAFLVVGCGAGAPRKNVLVHALMQRFYDSFDVVGSSAPFSKQTFWNAFQKRVEIDWWGGPPVPEGK